MDIKSIVKSVIAKAKQEAGVLEGEAESLLHPIAVHVEAALTEAEAEFSTEKAALEADFEAKAAAVEAKVSSAVSAGRAAIKAALPALEADAEKAIDAALAIIEAAAKSA